RRVERARVTFPGRSMGPTGNGCAGINRSEGKTKTELRNTDEGESFWYEALSPKTVMHPAGRQVFPHKPLIMEIRKPSMNETCRAKAEAVGNQPGIYVFKDDSGRPIYVGKAKQLRQRLRSYFQETRPPDEKRERMLDVARDLETIVVDNEK